MIEIKIPEREEVHSIIKLLVNAYNMGYKDKEKVKRIFRNGIESEEEE